MTNRTSTEYKTYLAEDELPKAWLNIRAFMDTDHAPILNPATLEPMSVADLEPVFCTCLLYTSPSPRDPKTSRMPSSA